VEGDHGLHAAWVKDVFVFLAAAGIVVPLFHRARFGAVLGFLVVGIAVGPYGFGRLAADYPIVAYLTIDDPKRAAPFAELGVIFLLFLLGLELSFRRLWQLRRYVFGVGAAQVLLSAVAIGAGSFFAGASLQIAIVLGMALALSSTAIVMQLLRDQRRGGTQLGRLALSVLLFQDLMVVPILFVTGMLGKGLEGGIALPLAIALGQAALAVAVITVAGRFVVRPFLGFVAGTGSRDLMMALSVLVVVAAAAATGAAGLSTALGAFLAGVLLGETEYRHQIEVDLEPFKGLLLGLFFVTVGMSIDLRLIASQFVWVIAAVAGLLLLKAALLFAIATAFRISRPVSLESALLLSQAGEFAFVVISISRNNGLIDLQLSQFVTGVVGITMILTSLLAPLARWLAANAPGEGTGRRLPDGDDALSDHVVIAGFGRVGQTVARVLVSEKIEYLALDGSAAAIRDAKSRPGGESVFYGDATRPEVLEKAGLNDARALVVTIDDPDGAERLVAVARSMRPDLPVFVRARDRLHAARIAALGAIVVPEATEASLQIAGRLLEQLEFTADQVSQRLALARQAEMLDSPAAAAPNGSEPSR
jgi:CPA2 family monovalent cation:H+ antiporter-2